MNIYKSKKLGRKHIFNFVLTISVSLTTRILNLLLFVSWSSASKGSTKTNEATYTGAATSVATVVVMAAVEVVRNVDG